MNIYDFSDIGNLLFELFETLERLNSSEFLKLILAVFLTGHTRCLHGV